MKVMESEKLYLLVDASSAGNIKPIQVIEALFSEMVRPCRKMPFWSTEKRPI